MSALVTPDHFKRLREQLHMSQQELALMLHVSRGTVARYESGMRHISKPLAALLERIVEEDTP